MHFFNIIKDEICAAGLDGIPISHLWKVLQEPYVQFPLAIDSNTKEFLWERIKQFKNFDFYVKPTEPAPYIYFDRFDRSECDFELTLVV